MQAHKNTKKCKYTTYPHQKHSRRQSQHVAMHTHTPFSSACPHLPPTGLCVSVAGVAQRSLTDQACDKQADWGGRENELQRPVEYATWQMMLFMPLWIYVPHVLCSPSWVRTRGNTMQSLLFEVLRKGPLGFVICWQIYCKPLQAYLGLNQCRPRLSGPE